MKKPFMIMIGDDFIKINVQATLVSEQVRVVDWDGSCYATKAQAERAIKVFGVGEDAKVVEVLAEMRQIHSLGQRFRS